MFDKTKAMRSAERYLSQGKIRDAISEYRQVVNHDPRDVITLNMLGDLYAKNSDARSAVKCYMNVADHYSRQGFAQKAIAVYNKISRLHPNSAEVTLKLAELYRSKGSLKEAKSHYTALAEHYTSQGRRIEALEIWKEIAALDPNNTEVYLTIADEYQKEGKTEDSVHALCNAGERFRKHSLPSRAVETFEKALEIDPKCRPAHTGLIEALIDTGEPEAAIERLQSLLEYDPLDRELLEQLSVVHLKSDDPASAEQAVLRLIEVDPSSYMKCLELARSYFDASQIDSAIRILTVASEHMLKGGQAGELEAFLREVEAKEPDRLDTIRLLARFASWQKDDEYLRTTLIRFFEIAAREGSIEDEKHALSQLCKMMPQQLMYHERLRAINEQFGLADGETGNDRSSVPSGTGKSHSAPFDRERVGGNSVEEEHIVESDEFAIVGILPGEAAVSGEASFAKKNKRKRSEKPEVLIAGYPQSADRQTPPFSSDEFLKEVESIRFYIENGYKELASKAIGELRDAHGEHPQIDELLELNSSLVETNDPAIHGSASAGPVEFEFGELQSELGLEDADQGKNSDFDTQFQTAVAYKEMGLFEQAISEFQDAAALVSPDDGTRRFFNCANLLGHCFMELGRPNLSVKWHLRSLESLEISHEERQGVWYEIGLAYEANGELENAAKYFEQVYVENIDFRDISERMKNIGVSV